MPAPAGQPHATASKLAQLLGEVLVHHAPHTAQIDAETRRRFLEDFLEGLEGHTQGQVTPILQKVLDSTDMPAEFKGLLQEAISPPAQFSAFLEQIFLYGIVSSIIGAAVSPFLVGVTNDTSAAALAEGIAKPVDPSVIATAAGRGLNLGDSPTVTVPAWAYTEAAKSGISADDINLQASLIGLPPALQELFELQRRGIITADQVKTGLQEGDFRDDWIDYAVQLAHGWLTPLDFVRAAVQSQMSYSDARAWAEKTGLDVSTALPIDTGNGPTTPDMFGLAFASAGRPPGPEELARAANRGDIPWDGAGADVLSFEQGIAESDVKTKWTPLLEKLAVYVPPPDAVGTLLERGAITPDQAVTYWQAGGVPDELAQGYAYIAQQEHIGQDKLLARGQVITGYIDGIFSQAQATTLLGDLGYHGDVAADILAIAGFRRQIQAINGVIRRVSSLYAGFKLTATKAKAAMMTVGLTGDEADELLSTWEALREQPVRLPSVAEIGGAVKYGTITQEQALDELVLLGYEPRDAAIVLSAHAEAKVSPLPDAGDTITG